MAGETQKKPRDSAVGKVRSSDVEPYTALRWLGTLFKAAGVRFYGTQALPELLGNLARTTVLAVVLWGGGDLVRLLIQLGNDVRAERILLSRLVHRTPPLAGQEERHSQGGALEAASLLDDDVSTEDSGAVAHSA
jgi:hypothetical protein